VDQIALLLDSFDPPERSLYRARLADFVDQQLGMLLQRTRLAERRAQLKREIAQIEEDLATRKLMPAEPWRRPPPSAGSSSRARKQVFQKTMSPSGLSLIIKQRPYKGSPDENFHHPHPRGDRACRG
jgi:hypothetical protein